MSVSAAVVRKLALSLPESTEQPHHDMTSFRVRGKIFAMVVRGRFVAKLPKARVEDLVGRGRGVPFDPGHGRLMKEWVVIASGTASEWIAYARESQAFITDNSKKRSVK